MIWGLQAKLIGAGLAALLTLATAGWIGWQGHQIDRLKMQLQVAEQNMTAYRGALEQARANAHAVEQELVAERQRVADYRKATERVGHGETVLPTPQRDVLEFLQHRVDGGYQDR